MSETRICSYCGAVVPTNDWCQACVVGFSSRRPAEEMTPDERAAEMRRFAGPVSIPFDLIHQRIEELVGRSVWTHEIGLDWNGLVAEAGKRREAPTMDGIVDLIPADKRIVLNPDDD